MEAAHCTMKGAVERRKLQEEDMISGSYIPDDIKLCILWLIPLEEVIRLKCLNKAWYALVHFNYKDFYLERVRQESLGIIVCWKTAPIGVNIPRCDNGHRRIRGRKRNNGGVSSRVHVSSVQTDGSLKSMMLTTELPENGYLKMMPSVNSLICLTTEDVILICNPITGDWRILPHIPDRFRLSPMEQAGSYYGRGLAFGYNPATQEYKVISIYNDYQAFDYPFGEPSMAPFEDLQCRVLTLSSDIDLHMQQGKYSSSSWRSIEQRHRLKYPLKTESVSVAGFIYWQPHFWEDEEVVILEFDLAEEKFKRVRPPPTFVVEPADINLARLQGRLCACRTKFWKWPTDEKSIDIWMMLKEKKKATRDTFNDVEEDEYEWVRLYKFDVHALQPFLNLYGGDWVRVEFSCLDKGKLIIKPPMCDSHEPFFIFDVNTRVAQPSSLEYCSYNSRASSFDWNMEHL